MIDEAVVLCGGRGQRLRPYTDHTPKPMLMVGDKPVLEYVVKNLIRNGIRKAYFAVGYLGSQIEEYFGNGSKFGIKIEYEYEEKPLNTAGAILQFKERLKEDFFIVSGDHITSWNLNAMGKFHKKIKPMVTIGFIPKRISIEFGIAEIKDNYVKSFREKPMEQYLINTGIYVMNKKSLKYIEVGMDLSKDVFRIMLKNNEKIGAYVDDKEFWMDIGRVKDYERMNELLSVIRLESKLFDFK